MLSQVLHLAAFVMGSAPLVSAMHLPHRETMSKRDTNCDLAVDNTDHYDCENRPKLLNSDGSCGTNDDWSNTEYLCAAYCEVRRKTFLGPMQVAPGRFGEATGLSESIDIAEGTEYTISEGISVAGDGSWEDAIGLGASFEFSIETTSTMTITRNGEQKHNYASQWVLWPILSTTCGSVTSKEFISGTTSIKGDIYPDHCSGDAGTTINVCSTAALLNEDGTAHAWWSQWYFDESGNPAPDDVQTDTYLAARDLVIA
ncbi:hypothetical protein F5Y18DRAFT_306276 [Xylariaceae sp. FL1019]|nr:hypothetical protein F5Y18DRAFT_306276 [Xylariaceae sp. FL1019]